MTLAEEFAAQVRISRTRPTCSIDGCSNVVEHRGMCVRHLREWRRERKGASPGAMPRGPQPLDYRPRYAATNPHSNSNVTMQFGPQEWGALDELARRKNLRRSVLAREIVRAELRKAGLL